MCLCVFSVEPTIDDLLKRREDLWSQLSKIARKNDWDIDPSYLHELWAEKSLVENTLHDRRMFGEFGELRGKKTIFLCHSSSDKGMVRMVHDDLKHVGVECWMDENKIKVGDSIVSKISEGLSVSPVMILFLSPKSVESMWARKEWQSFLSRQLSGDTLNILPALLESCKIPSILSDIKYADFRESYYDGFKQIYEALK